MQVQRCCVPLSARTGVFIHAATATFRAGSSQLKQMFQNLAMKATKSLEAPEPSMLIHICTCFWYIL